MDWFPLIYSLTPAERNDLLLANGTADDCGAAAAVAGRVIRKPNRKTALVILNQPLIPVSSSLFQQLWADSAVHVCADGGTNRLYDGVGFAQQQVADSAAAAAAVARPVAEATDAVNHSDTSDRIARSNPHPQSVGCAPSQQTISRDMYRPDVIVGDFDSIRTEVKTFYSSSPATTIVHSPSENYHDMDKAILCAVDLLSGVSPRPLGSAGSALVLDDVQFDKAALAGASIVVLGGLGGRFDHTMACISSMLRWTNAVGATVTVITPECTVTMLPAGRHNIVANLQAEGPTCGLLPVCEPCMLTTSGFTWNLENGRIAYGELVSSSNSIDTTTVDARHPSLALLTVQTSAPLTWTTELHFAHA
ncbi:thiamin pyrophosphokinase 1 [Capsaspora owczarzaki ATCC 30864]|uniref:Thiamin pyrophosphokinase 1 n=1 Tax=Capsaspora owczarzaki (strain ATCC 30864) TaxID=595528 RepID=A0A0D2WPS2_CAPO3|nr:thiamin pyrophosphokinase 1 [Capsaspora owczarzaki ATCC 30864]KJE93480.1 thiamin pyrophosphokinase 1 [Capsaspora owczarzaki ATCC 30864]|eukprot:XP_004348092.2 thiamin pyrophosphokinase 1 [Capsaspora owczarzaki ATCC 30864]